MSVKNNHLSSSQRGSILVYAVLIIVFFAGLAVFLRGSSTPVFSHIEDTRRQYEVEYLLDSVSHIMVARCPVELTTTVPELVSCLNKMKKFKIRYPKAEGSNVATVWRNNQGFISSDINTNEEGRFQIKDVEFLIQFPDDIDLIRKRTLNFKAEGGI